MGFESRRPPLPAPTESILETSAANTEVATNLTTRTDNTHISIPEDGSPITLSTQRPGSEKGGGVGGTHRRQKSQTSLLIEYFEAGQDGNSSKSKPSVRVRVTPSASKKGKSAGHDSVQITGIGRDQKPSYTRRISLGGKPTHTSRIPKNQDTELSLSSTSTDPPPVEIEFLPGASEVSNPRSSRGLLYAHQESNVSSMPPDSMLGVSEVAEGSSGRDRDYDEIDAIKARNRLKAPSVARDRSTSQDRITQRVMEKLGQKKTASRRSSKSSLDDGQDLESYMDEHAGPSYKTNRRTLNLKPEVGSSIISSQLSPSQLSYRSGTSQGSRMTNNPKLLEMVEDTIKRMILPEINAIKEDQKLERTGRKNTQKRSSFDNTANEEDSHLVRRVSKSSSTPNISSKPKVVLNRNSESPGTVLSRGDSEHRQLRKSSRESADGRRSSSRRSSRRRSGSADITDDDSPHQRRSEKSNRGHKSRDAAIAALVGGGLTTAALKSHDSRDEVRQRRRDQRKLDSSRSRSASLTETVDSKGHHHHIPPMPLTGRVADSELTRESLLSTETDLQPSPDRRGTQTPKRSELRKAVLVEQAQSPLRTAGRPSNSPRTTKERVAALAAAAAGGVGGVAAVRKARHVDADGYGDPTSPMRPSSMSSVSSLKQQFEDRESLIPQEDIYRDRSRSPAVAAAVSSQSPRQSQRSSPATARLAQSRQSPLPNDVNLYAGPNAPYALEDISTPGTPNGETVDDWYERQHQTNEKYRNSYAEPATNRSSYQTNPYSDDGKRYRSFHEDSPELYGAEFARERDVRPIAGVARLVRDSIGVESNVASLMEPSMLSSSVRSSRDDSKSHGTYADRMQDTQKQSPIIYQGSTVSQTMPSQARWAALKGHAKALSDTNSREGVQSSPQQSDTRSVREQASLEPVMGASGLPVVDDPLPEIGHFDDSASDVTTNPSIIQGPLGGDITGNNTWPYTPDSGHPTKKILGSRGSMSEDSVRSQEHKALNNIAGVVNTAAIGEVVKGPVSRSERSTPDLGRRQRNVAHLSPAQSGSFTDNDYNGVRLATGTSTPKTRKKLYADDDADALQKEADNDAGDPFVSASTDERRVSGRSHGMGSPLYDSATGNGLDRIQSQDIVALMDHLTVRDAQRNARDTEILVTLVRSAAEMRQSFDEMRRFIVEQDRLIMENTSRDAEHTMQKLMNGPRPQPTNASRVLRTSSQEDVQTKRKNILRRALRGLTGGKRVDDLARVEDMLMQILDNVEDLKQNGNSSRPSQPGSRDGDNVYEQMRGQPNLSNDTASDDLGPATARWNEALPLASRSEKQEFHSGYDGRRGSATRVSTVAEGDEDDDLEPHERHILDHQFENNERMNTPTQESFRASAHRAQSTPPRPSTATNVSRREEVTPRGAEKHHKHMSSGSANFAPPKVSRWSKTTASSVGPDPTSIGSPNLVRTARPRSETSHSQLGRYEDYPAEVLDEEPLRSSHTLARSQGTSSIPYSETRSVRSQHSQHSHLTRTPSPLIPSDVSHDRPRNDQYSEGSPVQDDYDPMFDDPKYQAHRNSLLLQHPQPRQGSTSRHQNTLETQAQDYENPSTSSDVSQRSTSDFDPANWGSSGTAALSRNRFVDTNGPHPSAGGSYRDDGPLVPHPDQNATTSSTRWDDEQEPETESDDDMEWEPQYSNSGFSRTGHYSSPYGSGHLLEPIEEVRNSLETDRTLSPKPNHSIGMNSPTAGKIGGPRPMGGRHTNSTQPSSKGVETYGTVRRKPVSDNYGSQESLQSESF